MTLSAPSGKGCRAGQPCTPWFGKVKSHDLIAGCFMLLVTDVGTDIG